MQKLSALILTFNSARYLDKIITPLAGCCDEIVVVDSGSTDTTTAIAEQHHCRIFFRRLDNFKNQRGFALEQCQHSFVLMVDSDEIPDDELVHALSEFKKQPAASDAYRIRREWYVLGKKIHAVYPVVSPDFPVRLFDKRIADFQNSPVVHEEPSGYKTIGVIKGTLQHHTFETEDEINAKLERYSELSAQTLISKKKNLGKPQQYLSSIAAFIKWYFAKGGWKDGKVGVRLASFAFEYTFRKYEKARRNVVSDK